MNVIWLPPPSHPVMCRGEVHVWFCDFSGITNFGIGHQVLGEDEVRRVSQFRSEEARYAFVGSHIFLRHVLGGYLQLRSDRVRFAADEGGKPCLDIAVHSTALQFNLSHSHRSAICAVADSVAVGIDIEFCDPKLYEFATAEQVFSPQELRRLQELGPADQCSAFFRGWTKKEAYAKCNGMGLTEDMRAIELGLDTGNSNFENMSLTTFECPGGYTATLAVSGAPRARNFWRLEAENLMKG